MVKWSQEEQHPAACRTLLEQGQELPCLCTLTLGCLPLGLGTFCLLPKIVALIGLRMGTRGWRGNNLLCCCMILMMSLKLKIWNFRKKKKEWEKIAIFCLQVSWMLMACLSWVSLDALVVIQALFVLLFVYLYQPLHFLCWYYCYGPRITLFY